MSLLRCTKFVRYFTGAAKSLVHNSAKSAESNLLHNLKTVSAVNNVFLRDYASSQKSQNLEPLLQKLDADVKRVGRITKKDIDEIFNEIKSNNDITSSQSLVVIRCCGELMPEELPEQRTILAQKIWNVLIERGIPMDISHYNALLKVYTENEHPFSPAQFLEELESKGLQPNRVTYQRLMWRYCQEGDVEGATKVLEKMRELNMPASEPVLNALVMGHAFHGDTDGANAILETMVGAGLEPTNRTYTLLACGYAKNGDIEGVEKIISNAKQKEEVFTNKNILDVVEYLAVNGHGDKVDQLFQHLQKSTGFNQDVYNAVLRLVNKGQEETAKKIMKIMYVSPNARPGYKGAFFIKQLMRVPKPADDIINTCREVQREGLVPDAFYIATEAAFVNGQTELAQKLFNELTNEGIEIREHYYWPLLVQKAKEDDEEGLMQILRNMITNNLSISAETMKKYIIPYLIKKDTPENTILKLQIAGIPTIVSARNVMVQLLEDGNIAKAAEVALQYCPRSQLKYIEAPLVKALGQTQDVNSFVTILHVITSKGPGQVSIEDESAKEESENAENSIVNNISRIVKLSIKELKNPHLCESLLEGIHNKGLIINTNAADAIEKHLGENMTSTLSQLLTDLTSSDFDVSPVESPRRATKEMSSAQLAAQLSFLQKKGISNVNHLQKQLLLSYIKDGDVEKLNSYLEELKVSGFELTPGTLAQLFEFYSEQDDIQRAQEFHAQLKEKSPDFMLNNRAVYMAYALVKANRVDEAIQFLKDNKPVLISENINYKTNSKCWHMLNTLVEQKNVEKVTEMANVLIENNYIEPSNAILGCVVKANILADDVENALKLFEQFCKQYKKTPWRIGLMKALIMKEDATKLQFVADLNTEIYGEVSSLHNLVLAFVECGRLRQARRILETLRLQTPHEQLAKACERYVEEGKPECLEGLLEVTKDLSHIDRPNIFYHLLVSYCKADDTDKALGLWTILQEEGEIPTDQFLQYLGQHLKSKNLPVPFVVSDKKNIEKKILNNTQTKKDKDIAAKAQAKKEKVTEEKNNITIELQKIIDNGQLSQAVEFAIKSIQNGNTPKPNVLKYLVKLLAEAGDVENIKKLGNIIDEPLAQRITYNHKLTLASFMSGSAQQHIDNLLNTVQSSESETDLKNVLKQYPPSTALALIMEDEDLLDKCVKIANIAAEKGQLLPVNLLWMEMLLCGKEKEANELWTKWLKQSPAIRFRRLLEESHIRKEPKYMEILIELLKTNSNVTNAAIGNVYSRIINYLLVENKLENAEEKFREAQKFGITTADINKSTIRRLKEAIQESGREFELSA